MLPLSSNCLDETLQHMSVSKNRGNTPKMDGENNGKPYEQMDDLGVFPYFWVDTHISAATGHGLIESEMPPSVIDAI